MKKEERQVLTLRNLSLKTCGWCWNSKSVHLFNSIAKRGWILKIWHDFTTIPVFETNLRCQIIQQILPNTPSQQQHENISNIIGPTHAGYRQTPCLATGFVNAIRRKARGEEIVSQIDLSRSEKRVWKIPHDLIILTLREHLFTEAYPMDNGYVWRSKNFC